MKTRRISTRRIGTGSKGRKRGSKGNVLFSVLALAVVVVMLLAYLTYWPPDSGAESIVQITVIATVSPLPTATAPSPTLTPSPTLSPVIAPTPAPVFGMALGDVWLRKIAGGEMLPAAVLKGQRVEILEVSGDYLKVQWTDGETTLAGWVTAEWIEVQ